MNTIFTSHDIECMQKLGISEESSLERYHLLQQGVKPISLVRPCLKQDGIFLLRHNQFDQYLTFYEEAKEQGRLSKFVPASGAASRMFDSLDKMLLRNQDLSIEAIKNKSCPDDDEKEFLYFTQNLSHFSFYEDLKESLKKQGLSLQSLQEQDHYRPILENLLYLLQYRTIPKALLQFHRYKNRSITAMEEHLHEANAYSQGNVHFTIAPNRQEEYYALQQEIMSHLLFPCHVSYSYQELSTQGIVLDVDTNLPLRDSQGNLVFYPSGHGALLANLSNLHGDIVFIKNIDNVCPPHKQALTVFYKKILAGLLLSVQHQIFSYLRMIQDHFVNDAILQEIQQFLLQTFGIILPNYDDLSSSERKESLFNILNRPLRVCGMVYYKGEVGGGPFWVHKDGQISVQIVEKSQVNLQDEQQKQIWKKATYVNPVDLVCGLKDFQGNNFDLMKYADFDQYFISQKSYFKKNIRVLELPGLWNGSMAFWNTILVDIPIHTFNPVKKITDLLSVWHQS